MQYEHAGMEML